MVNEHQLAEICHDILTTSVRQTYNGEKIHMCTRVGGLIYYGVLQDDTTGGPPVVTKDTDILHSVSSNTRVRTHSRPPLPCVAAQLYAVPALDRCY